MTRPSFKRIPTVGAGLRRFAYLAARFMVRSMLAGSSVGSYGVIPPLRFG
jgi:hypothetical protein